MVTAAHAAVSTLTSPLPATSAQVEDYFTRLVQRVAPKHDAQARAEVVVTRRFLENFSGDQVPSFLAVSAARSASSALTESLSAHMPAGSALCR